MIVIPAKAGIHLRMRVNERRRFIPRQCAGTQTKGKRRKMDSGFLRNDGERSRLVEFFNNSHEHEQENPEPVIAERRNFTERFCSLTISFIR